MSMRTGRKIPVVLFGVLLALDVTVFLLQKTASKHAGGQGIVFFEHLGLEWWTWMALAIGPAQLWIWTRILGRVDISLAYPLTSLAYPLTLLCAEFILGESLHWQVWVGAILITLGSAIMAGPKTSEPEREAIKNSDKFAPRIAPSVPLQLSPQEH